MIGSPSQICSYVFFFFKQKTAYEISSRDWSSDVCSSDLGAHKDREPRAGELRAAREIQHPQCVPDLPVRPATLRGRLAPCPHDLVVRGVAVRQFREREVRDVEQLLLERCLDTLELRLEGVDPLAQRAARPPDVRRERSLLLHQTRIGFGGLVALPL